MKAQINNRLIIQLQPKEKRFDVWDTKITGFHVRVNTNGHKIYRCMYRQDGIRRIYTIGDSELTTPSEAREQAKAILGNAIQGHLPNKQKPKTLTLEQYIETEYTSWRIANTKSGQTEVNRLKKFYAEFSNTPLEKISTLKIDRWRTARKKAGISAITINRDVASLRSALSKALEWKLIAEHPLRALKPLKTEDNTKIRFLSVEEGKRLRAALIQREKELQESRARANHWRTERQYETYPELNGDHLKPMALLSLNTGLRRGELLNLRINQIDFKHKILTVLHTKSAKNRHIPLNKEALESISEWFQTASLSPGSNDLVFANPVTGEAFKDVKKAWTALKEEANITDFRWHDMRHHFASWLVMAGVPLNTVRELLGHSDIKMTLRYAHLTPGHKSDAVAKLDAQLKE